MAAAMRVPARKLEVFRVTTSAPCVGAAQRCAQLIADVVKRLTVQCVIVLQDNSYPDNEIKVLPACEVSRPICDVRFCGGEAAGVLE